MPTLATDSKIDESAVEKLKQTAQRLLGSPDDLVVVKKGLCFRPVTTKGTPILSRIPDKFLGNVNTRAEEEGGVWLAAGHDPRGESARVWELVKSWQR